jgi:hypothetical protein
MIHHALRECFGNFLKLEEEPSMSKNRVPIEMLIMPALKFSRHRVVKQMGLGLAALSLIALMVAPLSAQTFRGSILGTVMDPNAAVVPRRQGHS